MLLRVRVILLWPTKVEAEENRRSGKLYDYINGQFHDACEEPRQPTVSVLGWCCTKN